MEEDDARIDTCCPVGARYDHSPSCWDSVKMKCTPSFYRGANTRPLYFLLHANAAGERQELSHSTGMESNVV